MTDSDKGHHRKRIIVAGAAIVTIVAATGWMLFRAASATFSEHPRATRIAFAELRGDVLIKYQMCGDDDLIPYVDAWEVISDDLHEWEVHAHLWGPNEASWITGRDAQGDEGSVEPSADEYEGSIPPEEEIRMNVHLYSASIENRWHVRVEGLPVRDLPDFSSSPREVMSAEGETMIHNDWHQQANSAC